MNRRAALGLTAAALLSVALPVLAADPKAEIQAVYARAEALFKKKDVAGLKGLLTPDCTFHGADGQKLTVAQWEAQLSGVYKSTVGPIQYRTVIRSAVVQGQKATVEAQQKVSMKVKDNAGKVHTIEMDETSVDTLVRVGGSWKMRASTTKKSVSKLDGKPAAG